MQNKGHQENFGISALQPNDATGLHGFVRANTGQLQHYLPRTLASNDSIEKTKAYILLKQQEINEKTNFTFAIKNKSTEQIAGLVILKKIDWLARQAELAYCIGSEYEGKGITSQAVKEMTKLAFGQLALETLRIITHKTNTGSIRVAEKNGFTRKAALPNEFTPPGGTPLEMELYELKNER